ncbi:AHH domain-containing protein [Myxococcota bacterium]|nr:AHH domain-containing protein [Myxococcota bacterium]
METAGVPLPPGFQAHHLIPDEVARTHPLAQAARARGVPPWDLDNPQNGVALPGSPDKVGTTGLPVHRGSHKNYTEYARDALSTRHDALVREYGGLDKVPPEVLVKTMKELERTLREDLVKIPTLRNTNGRLH